MLFYVLGVFSVVVSGLSAIEKPAFPVTTCKRELVDYSACLKRAIEEAWPRFIAGLPEFDFPPLDPLFYEYGRIVVKSGEVRGEIIASNVTTIGMSKAGFLNVRTNFLDDVFRLEIDTQIPKLYIKGTIQIDGTISIFRAAGKDHFNITTEDIRTTWDLIGNIVNDTWTVEHLRVAPSFGKLKIHFNSLIQNKVINDIVVSFLNEYWPPIYRVILPVAADAWEPWLNGIANKLFSKVSFSKIFP